MTTSITVTRIYHRVNGYLTYFFRYRKSETIILCLTKKRETTKQTFEAINKMDFKKQVKKTEGKNNT